MLLYWHKQHTEYINKASVIYLDTSYRSTYIVNIPLLWEKHPTGVRVIFRDTIQV